jgi:hypothetical protein
METDTANRSDNTGVAKLSAEFVKGRPVEPGGLSQERESNER